MPEVQPDRLLGCLLTPAPADVPSVHPLLGAGPLPEQFIVPAWRDCFTVDFQEIPDRVSARIADQSWIDACVGHAFAVLKSSQEGVAISERDVWRRAKRLDGNPLAAYGTTMAAGADALVAGAAEKRLVAADTAVGRDRYLSEDDVNEEVRNSREAHRGRAPFFVPRTDIRRTLAEFNHPLAVSCMWHEQDNGIRIDGYMRPAASRAISGHAFAVIGWIKRGSLTCLVMVNSFGSEWGCHGLFFVPLDGTENRLANAWATLDIEKSLADVLARYTGKDVIVPGKPEHWRIEAGRRRRYPDEVTWWAHGRLFGIEVYEIPADELALIPAGADMSIAEAPFNTRELVRQIRQSVGLR